MLPQSAQYLLPSGFSKPQFGHLTIPNLATGGTLRLWPQFPQNFWPSGLSAPQLGHFMTLVQRIGCPLIWSYLHKSRSRIGLHINHRCPVGRSPRSSQMAE